MTVERYCCLPNDHNPFARATRYAGKSTRGGVERAATELLRGPFTFFVMTMKKRCGTQGRTQGENADIKGCHDCVHKMLTLCDFLAIHNINHSAYVTQLLIKAACKSLFEFLRKD